MPVRMSSKFVLARIPFLCNSAGMRKKPMTIQEMARMGGKARAANMTAEQRKKAAKQAIAARWAKAKKEKAS